MEQIISIATVCVTLVLGISGLIFNSMIQRKSNSIKMVTQHRFERRSETQKIAATLTKYSDPDLIRLLSSEEEKRDAVKEVVDACSRLRSMYFRSYPCDIRLLDKADELKQNLVAVLLSRHPATDRLLSSREAFIKEADLYVTTEWQRIKLETIGKRKIASGGLGTWEEDYRKTLHFYDRWNEKKQDKEK